MSNNIEGLKKSSLFHILIIATLAIGLYSNTLKNGFVYDDIWTIMDNTLVKSFDNLPLMFDKTAYFIRSGEMSYRPVVTFTYFFDYALYGLKPWGYHLTNVLLHALNGGLLYFFLTLLLTPGTVPILHSGTGFQPVMTGKMPVPANKNSPLSHSSLFTSLPFLISLLFVTHPVLTEAVNCISYREDLLVFLFYMTTLSLYLILRQPTSDHRSPATALFYLLSCLTYLLALFSKEMAFTLPLIVFCYEWFYGWEKAKLLPRLFNRYIMGYIAITLFYLYLRFYLFHNTEEVVGDWSLIERFLTLPWLVMNYLKLSLFPVQLSADYVINPVSSPFSPIVILSLIALISIFAIILRHSPFVLLPSWEGKQTVPSPLAGGGQGEEALRQRSLLFGVLFFLITLTPVYGLVPLFNPFAERYLYLPVAGFVLFAVLLSYLIVEKLKVKLGHGNRYMPIFFLGVLIVFSFSVVKRNTIWKDNYSLWSDTVAKTPNSSRAYNNLGSAYYNQKRFDEAIEEYFTALKLSFDNAEAHYNLGTVYLSQGRYYEAIYELKMALRLKPGYADAYKNLGDTYLQQGLFDQAVKEYLTAIRLKPNNDERVHNNLGVAYFEQGRYDESINEFTITLKLKPDYKEAYSNLRSAYEKKEGLLKMLETP